jgi:hypothetical protein
MKSVNKAVRKKDAMELLLGKPVYTDDIAPKDCLVVKLLRSPYANAYVKSINTDIAMKYYLCRAYNMKSSISIDCTECPEGLHHTLLACLCMICPVNYNITTLKHLIYITITALIMCT